MDLSANWIFRLLENALLRPAQLDAVFGTFVVLGGFVPLLLCAPLGLLVFHGRAAGAIAAQALLMIACAEYLLLNWRAIPFTCTPENTQRHLIHSACVHLIELSVYSFSGAGWIRAAIHQPRNYLPLLLFVVGILTWLHRWRIREWGKEPLAFLKSAPQPAEALHLSPE